MRLGSWLPFEQVPEGLAHFTGVTVGRETARRLTEAAGAALVVAETATVEQLEHTWPRPDAIPTELQQVSVDGAMVPLVHGEWAEVKTLALGVVQERQERDGTRGPQATALSYFSRLTDADQFRRLAWKETHRRGVTLAPQVCGVVDGAEWCQAFLDWHCPDAVRILDFSHAAAYVSAAARSVFGAGTAPLTAWLDQHLHELEHGDPDVVIAALRALPEVWGAGPDGLTCARNTTLAYLEKRRGQIAYRAFREAGYPIGSGAVESANKLVVEVRLKGSGMHWARPNVNPLLALRGAGCSDQWTNAWRQVRGQQQSQGVARRQRRCAARRVPPRTPPPVAAPEPPVRTAVARLPLGRMKNGRPSASHPWRKPFFRRSDTPTLAKT